MKTFFKTILLFFLCCAVSESVQACTCLEMDVPVCEQYRRADAVFVGRVKNVESPQNPLDPSSAQSIINFEVERSFKGTNESSVKIGYMFGTSCSWIEKFSKGERWLIYGYRKAEGGILTIPFCTGSRLISEGENAEVTYFSNLTQGKTKESVIGNIIGEDISNNTQITIKGNGKTYTAQTNEGNFNVDVDGTGDYKVRAVIPFSVVESNLGFINLSPLNFISMTEKETIVEYDIQVERGLCGYRQVNFLKLDLKATALIGGKIINPDGKPVSNLWLRLKKADVLEENPSERNINEKTDQNGVFEFSELREGRYVIVVNPKDFPEYDTPYLRTYYPGVRNYFDAQVIEIKQGQNLSDLTFQMPKELPQREIRGKIVWADGKPVKEKDKPFLSLYDSKAEYVSTPLNSFKIDSDGQFSYSLFEGYTYLVKIEANTKTGWTHGFEKIKVDKNLKPIKIVLNRQGFGKAENFLKELESKQQ